MKHIDALLALLVLLLLLTLGAFFSGLFPYPLGWLVLLALIAARVTHLRRRR